MIWDVLILFWIDYIYLQLILGLFSIKPEYALYSDDTLRANYYSLNFKRLIGLQFMIVTQSLKERVSTYLIIFSIPFSYYSIGSVRLLPIFILLALLLTLMGVRKIHYKSHMLVLLLLMILIFIGSLLTNDFDNLFTSSLFFIIMYWPQIIPRRGMSYDNFFKYIKLYVILCIVIALGVVIQYSAYQMLGIEFGKIDFFYERTGFGFIWTDYSFLSLYLTSTIPLVFYIYKSKFLKYSLSTFLLISSLITTARTGFYALLIFCCLLIAIQILRYFLNPSLKIRIKKLLLLSSLLIILPIALMAIIPKILEAFPRLDSTNSSGRIEGYIEAIQFGYNHLLFGAYFSTENYKSYIDVLPHNLFIYIFALGGIIFFIIFMIWLILIITPLLKSKNKSVISSVIVIFIGLQFVPSFFSAYYLAMILSFFLYYKRLGLETIR